MTPNIRKRSRLTEPRSGAGIEAITESITNWPAEGPHLQIERVPPENLRLPNRRLRRYAKKHVEGIKALIRQCGFINPIVVDRNFNIFAGVARCEAAIELKLPNVPILRAEHLSEAQLRAYALADNKLVENGSWDEELLAVELTERYCQTNQDLVRRPPIPGLAASQQRNIPDKHTEQVKNTRAPTAGSTILENCCPVSLTMP